MSAPLLRKELREQRPVLFFGLFLVALDLVSLGLSEAPDLRPLAVTLAPALHESWRVTLFLLAFALATGLLRREEDEGTLEFLDALPVTRTRLFLVKVAVAVPVLMAYPVCTAVLQAVQQLASRTSLAGV